MVWAQSKEQKEKTGNGYWIELIIIIPNLVVLSWYIPLCTLGSRNSQAFVAGHSSGFCKRNESDSGGASPFRRFEAILTRYLQHPQKQMTNPSKSLRPYH